MTSKQQATELYKLCTNPNEHDSEIQYVTEMGWVDSEFLVYVSYVWLNDFIKKLKEIFGLHIFDDGSFGGVFLEYCVCFDLCEAVGFDIDLEYIFPKDQYQH